MLVGDPLGLELAYVSRLDSSLVESAMLRGLAPDNQFDNRAAGNPASRD